MLIGIPKETKEGERRVSLTPDVAKSLINAGYSVQVESGAGEGASFSDDDYKNAGANIVDKDKVYSSSQVVMKVNNASVAELGLMKKDAVYMSLMFASANREIVAAGASAGISMFSMDAIPRISRAQKMDVLSSQSNLAGYKTVMLGAHYLGKIFPMLMTAAGTIKPSRVVIMGAGVAGLQAIATAKRLGAIVEVSDIRPETKEQVESLGVKYIEVKGDASVKTGGGYVTSVSDEFLKMKQELFFKHNTKAD